MVLLKDGMIPLEEDIWRGKLKNVMLNGINNSFSRDSTNHKICSSLSTVVRGQDRQKNNS
jgi:hypothetical protein